MTGDHSGRTRPDGSTVTVSDMASGFAACHGIPHDGPYDACPQCGDEETNRFTREECVYMDLKGEVTWTDDSAAPQLECSDCGTLSNLDAKREAATFDRANL